ncbi:MAG TPA: SMP-30/gluconolactonase/LRE family protein [Castellaniella sp.]|uniref:SMP-30/gluconolactonase/LRE family protein n=1 Tax=Castellaniella sp. TaxID=1955812 RepID=UPI002EFED565
MTTPQPSAELVLDLRCQTGECPVWHAASQSLYWVDIPAGRLHCWRPADQKHQSWRFTQQLACIASLSSGDWLGAMEDGVYRLGLAAGEPVSATRLVAVDHPQAGMRFNDGRCDRQGRFWVGSMVMDMGLASPAGALYRLQGSGSGIRLDKILDDFLTLNGLGFSPDGRTLYVSDSHPQRQCVWAFDYDPDAGVPSRRRVFIDRLPAGRPDGAAVDAEGCYWITGNDAGVVHRYTPEGRLDRTLKVPVAKPSMCAFGGPRLDTLFVTTIRQPTAAPDALDGSVFALQPGVVGLEEPGYSE